MRRQTWASWSVLAGCLLTSACSFLRSPPHFNADEALLKRCEKCEKNPTVRALAADIDKVEWLINRDGSIVAKTPSIWGEARLAKHRREYEEQMASQLTTFDVTMQGYVARSDQAYLSEALSLSNAAAAGNGSFTVPQNVQTMIPNTVTVSKDSKGADTTSVNTNVYQTPPFAGLNNLGFVKPDAKLSLEPVLQLDQRSRFLQHLQELRRINEGDDTADAPGYSLNLVRVPVSILPGKHTRKGHGAEITMTITPRYGCELLPRTFRNLVNNDVKDLVGITLWGVLFSAREVKQEIRRLEQMKVIQVNRDDPKNPKASFSKNALDQVRPGSVQRTFRAVVQPDGENRDVELNKIQGWHAKKHIAKNQGELLPAAFDRRNRLPLSPTQILEVVGIDELIEIDNILFPEEGKQPLQLDVFKFIGAEVESAYDLICQPQFKGWWKSEQPRLLAATILQNDLDGVKMHRESFRSLCNDYYQGESRGSVKHRGISKTTSTLAWVIAIESALLNEGLNEDLKEIVQTRHCACPAGDWFAFYGPDPQEDAQQAFVEYVKCRWPIHVFALDPVTQDENLGDVYSRRREMQLAMSLAFVTGKIGIASFTRYARRLEADMATIALHRTAAGFAHGENHFGWWFRPRFQTPPFEGNLTAIFRDQIRGGPNKDDELLEMEIEPGMRECVAVVIMPSIISEVGIDTSSRWFKLTNPKHDDPNTKRTVDLSEAIQRMQTCAANVVDACNYRDGELERLLHKVEQLSARLSLQTLRQQVPVENTLGGFAMFSSGQTDLAPRLTGYYGEPVVLGRDNVIYLVGDHFSVHETRVLAGNRDCDFKMLSRRVLQVTLPGGANFETDEKGEYGPEGGKVIDLHVATPYGVTGHTKVTVDPAAGQSPKTSYTWAAPQGFGIDFTVTTSMNVDTVNVTSVVPRSGELAIDVPDNFPVPAAPKIRLSYLYSGSTIATSADADLVYDAASKRLLLRSAALSGLNVDPLKAALIEFLKPLRTQQSILLEVRGQLAFDNKTFHTIPGSLSVIVTNVTPKK